MKLEITKDGLVFSEVYSGLGIRTPMGLFGIAQRDGGIEVLFTVPGGTTTTVYSAHQDATPSKPPLWLDPSLTRLPLRVPAHAHGPRMGKAAKPITGTISREEFVEAYAVYTRGGGQQDVEQLLNGGGFSLVELDGLSGHPPVSWIEGKLEALPQEDKLEASADSVFDQCPTCGFGADLPSLVFDCARLSFAELTQAHQLHREKRWPEVERFKQWAATQKLGANCGEKFIEDKLEDRATPALLVAEYAGIVPRDKLEEFRVPPPKDKRELFKECPTCGYGGDLKGAVYDCGRWARNDVHTAHQHYRAYRESVVSFGFPLHKDKLEDRTRTQDKLEDPTTIATGVMDKLEG